MSDHIRHDLGHFAMVPEYIVTRGTPAALKLWCILWIYTGNGTHHAWPSQSRLAQDMGCTDRTVRRVINELCDLGAMTSQQRDGTSNLYTLRWRPVDNPQKPDIHVRFTPDIDVLPPRTQMSYKERQSEIHNQSHAKTDTSVHLRTPGDNPLTREQIRKIREQAGGR